MIWNCRNQVVSDTHSSLFDHSSSWEKRGNETMKKKIIGQAIAGLCAAAMIFMGSFDAFAATAHIKAAADVSVGSDRKLNITAGKDRDLFSNMKGVMPGDVRSNTVTINNNSSQDLTFYLKAYPGYQGVDGDAHSAVLGDNKVTVADKNFHEDLLKLIGMKITLDGEIIFEGKADGSPELTAGDYGVSLGTIAAKTSKDMVVTIELPGAEMTNEYMDAFTAFDWVFIAEGRDSSGGGDGPNGGGGNDRPSGGGDRPSGDPVQVVTIDDGDVPLGAMGDSDVNIEIVDGQVPLASLAKTGGGEFHFLQIGMLLIALGAGLAVVNRSRKSYTE